MKYMRFFLGEQKKNILLLFVFLAVFLVLFALSQVPLSIAGYGFLLCIFLGAAVFGISYVRFYRRMETLARVSDELFVTLEHLPEAETGKEYVYQQLLHKMRDAYDAQLDLMYEKEQDAMEYNALWAHQIKTPIAAMHLLLQAQDGGQQELANQLFKIEQYVQMILNYQRLKSTSSDWVLKRGPLDTVIRQSVRKFAKQFIRKKLSLRYEGTDLIVLSDEKWLGFVLEQLLSNALKYTKSGEIHIYTKGHRLYIKDSGIGIRAEDLPRIFERGYTGYNGRADKKSTGIGLYLCREICEKLGHGISVESEVGVGTCVSLDLSVKELDVELTE